MTHFGFAIDPETNDLYLEPDGKLAVVRGAKAVGQHARQRCKTYEREWHLDTEAGLPWMDEILGKAVDTELSEAIVKAEILETDGVTGIEAFSIAFGRATRKLNIRDVKIATIYDEEVSL